MNIEVFGRTRPLLRGETSNPVFKVLENTVEVAETSHSFREWFDADFSNRDLYQTCLAQMVDLFLTGYNLSFFCLGESQSGRSFTLLGDNQSQNGVTHFAIQDLLQNIKQSAEDLQKKGPYFSTKKISSLSKIRWSANVITEYCCSYEKYEVYKEVNATSIPVADEDNIFINLKNGWNRRTNGHADNEDKGTVIIQFEAVTDNNQFGFPHRSFLTLVELPAFDSFKTDGQESRKDDEKQIDKTLNAMKKLLDGLSRSPEETEGLDFSESKAVNLLQDSFGGNSKTKVMVHFKPTSTEASVRNLLQFSSLLSQVKNYFILNDVAAQGLIGGMRARQLSLQRRLGAQSSQMTVNRDPPGNEAEVSRLRMENQYLSRKLDRLENQFSDVVAAKEDLSSRLISSEEERLRRQDHSWISRSKTATTEMGYTKKTFELKTSDIYFFVGVADIAFNHKFLLCTFQLMSCESQLLQERIERRRAASNVSQTHNLSMQYAELEDNYAGLIRKHDQEVKRNRELGMELLNLLNAEVALLQQQGNLKNSETEDLRKIKDIALGLAADREKVNDVPLRDLAGILSGDTVQFRRETEKMKMVYEQQQTTLENQIKMLNDSVQKSKVQALDAQRKLAQQEVELMMKKEEGKEMGREISSLIFRLKRRIVNTGEDFKSISTMSL
ncbi:putative centromere-associated protein E [Apostichopus japonicus]|uniref:Putative centromere-associated protein E n=1 Tax=Stichopus japonicus TaxID=307972 RepID=A0A2G8JD77_STIJA|nr:putative centromere-associated protein E [Apostichopus japonicus]